ncbi:hypothetical protein MMC13_003342 [Lambiella insularis]|nr:hypothetical protein [Lambiella insularis]
MALNVNFLRRTAEGPAIFVVQDVKLGRQTSVIHITVSQGSSREKVVGYLTRSNLETESGISLPTAWTLVPPPYPANLSLLMGGSDKQWERYDSAPFLEFRKASARVDFYLPRNGQLEKSIIDEWIRFASGELFTMGSLGYVADMFPQIIESYRETLPSTEKHQWGRLWYPTILLNLEMKKLLPPEGVQWLFVRVLAKQIKNGRMDLEVVVMDEGGDLIALSQHVCMIVGIERNTAERRDVPEKIAVKL